LSNAEHCIQAEFFSENPSPPDLSSVSQIGIFIELAVGMWEMVGLQRRMWGWLVAR
jgi:hypothetical protein